jgi:hypothetical protein
LSCSINKQKKGSFTAALIPAVFMGIEFQAQRLKQLISDHSNKVIILRNQYFPIISHETPVYLAQIK